MKTTLLLLPSLASIAFMLLTGPAHGHIHAFDASHLADDLHGLHEIDFEGFPPERPSTPPLPNPWRIGGVTFTDPWSLSYGFCSAPTCIADPDNPHGGNIELFLNPGATLSFAASPRLVILDIQGIGDNPFVLRVTDGRGHKLRVRDTGIYFGRNLLGLFSGHGIRKIELVHVGGTGGPLAVARVLHWGHLR